VDDEHHSMIATNPAQTNDGMSRRYYYGGSFRSFLHTSTDSAVDGLSNRSIGSKKCGRDPGDHRFRAKSKSS